MKVLEESIKKDVQESKKRIDQVEVNALMAELINRTAQDHMDEKFEEALSEVANQIETFANHVNDTTAKQYEEFSQNIRKAYG